MRKTIKSSLAITVLFIAATFVLLYQANRGVDFNKENIEVKRQKAPEVSMVQIPVLVEEVRHPKKLKVKTADRKRQVRKRNSNKEHPADRGRNKNKGNSVPNLFARYEMPVKEYLSYMRSKGVKVLVYDQRRKRFVCEILKGGTLSIPSGVEYMSSRSRRITDDFPHKDAVLNRVERYYGAGRYEILLLLPKKLEESIYKKISREVKEKRLNMSDIATVFVTYKGNASSVSVYIERVTGRFGTIKIGKTFRL